ncbi:MAG: hypothetical protein DMF80_11475 [Acidobacteria bacterium]|nr:MAG: hypothetical protein DMF80_11475 [Acidobacteriota bacterium]PYQ25578.1 MAG: hypothetical protein DMF81_01825 [Acidobacteriota bacterium]
MLLLPLGIAAVFIALFVLGRMRSRLEASFLADELRDMGEGAWAAVPLDPTRGPLSRRKLAGEVNGHRVEVAGSLLFLPFEHPRELAILRQENPAHSSEAFVPSGHADIDCALAFRSADRAWLRGFLAREDVRQALRPVCARADDPSFVAVRAGRGVGEIAYRKLVGSRAGLFYFRDPEAGPLDATDIRDLVRILVPLKLALA